MLRGHKITSIDIELVNVQAIGKCLRLICHAKLLLSSFTFGSKNVTQSFKGLIIIIIIIISNIGEKNPQEL